MLSIGIDCGTTNSVSCIYKDNTITLIPNKHNKYITPSVFSVSEEKEIIIGDDAIIQEQKHVINTIRSIKRHIGTNIKKKIWDKEYSPEEITSHILRYIKKYSEVYLETDCVNAVITVPAYFNNDQRASTKIAGELAGFNVLQIINEPTAAALSYGLGNNKNEKILVYDLGGGTFDVTILKINSSNVFEVLSTAGDTHLGGDDFDSCIINILLSYIGISMEHASYPIIHTVLRSIAENVKKQLSTLDFVDIDTVVKIHNYSYHLKCTITKEEFEKSIHSLLVRTKNCMNMAVRDSKLSYKEIDKIILVGGSTRIPYVRSQIKEWTGIECDTSVDPDMAVAMGASIQASLLSNSTTDKALLIDVTPLSLGIEVYGGAMQKMIHRNTPIPTNYSEIFSTVEDNQEKVVIKIYQGERPSASHNVCLGEFYLEDIPPQIAGIPEIEVTFQIDSNGILSIKAKDNATDKYKQITVYGQSSLSSEEIQKILEDSYLNEKEDMILRQKQNIFNEIQNRKTQIKYIKKSLDNIDGIDDIISCLESVNMFYNVDVMTDIDNKSQEFIKKCNTLLYEQAKQIMEKK